MEITVQEFQELEKKLKHLHDKRIKFDAEMSLKSEQLKNKLTEHGTKTISEFKKKKEELDKSSQELFVNASKYANELSDKFNELESKLHS